MAMVQIFIVPPGEIRFAAEDRSIKWSGDAGRIKWVKSIVYSFHLWLCKTRAEVPCLKSQEDRGSRRRRRKEPISSSSLLLSAPSLL